MTEQQKLDLSALAGAVGGRGPDKSLATNGADALDGTSGANHMAGLGGNDRLYGHGGDDRMTGGEGHDRVDGGSGHDLLAGGEDADTIQGGEGDDAVLWRPGEGNDEIHGGAGQDVLRLEQTGLTLGQLRDAIVLQDGSRPQIVDGRLLLGGQAGAVAIGAETIRFDGIGEIQLSEFSPFMYGR